MTEVDTIKVCGKCKEPKPLYQFNKNKNRPDGKAWDCKECNRKRCLARFVELPEKYKEASRKNYIDNKDRYLSAAKTWSEKNKEKRSDISRQYVLKNPKQRYETSKKHRLNNPGMYAAHFKLRQQRKNMALSGWANLVAMEAIYIECARITKETGIKHHVDHFYPLKSDIVCGLHNEFNLRIIPAKDNLSKGNSFPTEAS